MLGSPRAYKACPTPYNLCFLQSADTCKGHFLFKGERIRPKRAVFLDMFPQTFHIESVVALDRRRLIVKFFFGEKEL